jgi:hypothetical protein
VIRGLVHRLAAIHSLLIPYGLTVTMIERPGQFLVGLCVVVIVIWGQESGFPEEEFANVHLVLVTTLKGQHADVKPPGHLWSTMGGTSITTRFLPEIAPPHLICQSILFQRRDLRVALDCANDVLAECRFIDLERSGEGGGGQLSLGAHPALEMQPTLK